MSIISKILAKHRQKSAFNYLQQRMKLVTVKNIPLNKLLKNPEKGLSFYYSSFIIMCLNDSDKLVRISDSEFSKPKDGFLPIYAHGWVEFQHGGQWWVFDDRFKMPIAKEEWYKDVNHHGLKVKATKSDVLNHIAKTYGTNISKQDIWDWKYYMSLPYVKIEMQDGEVIRVEIDKNNKFFVKNPLEACETHWI